MWCNDEPGASPAVHALGTFGGSAPSTKGSRRDRSTSRRRRLVRPKGIAIVFEEQTRPRLCPRRSGGRRRSRGWLAAIVLHLVAITPPHARAATTFTDVAASLGVTHNQAATGTGDPMTGGAAAGDFDGDGLVDLFFTRTGGANVLYKNTGAGFQDVSAASGFTQTLPSSGVASGDIDNDGDLDLYVTTSLHNRFYMYMNDGAGHFTEQAVDRGAAVQASGIPNWRGMGVAMGDYDGDGYLDILTSDHSRPMSNNGARLLHNLGAANPGYFEDVTHQAGIDAYRQSPHVQNVVYRFQPQFSDVDRDGHVDILFSADDRTSQLFWNKGDGTFVDGTIAAKVGTDKSGMGSALGDYDGDGDLDWFVTAIYDTPVEASTPGNRLYRNNGDRTFTDVTTVAGVRNSGSGQEVSWGWGTDFFDYDNESRLDLMMTNGWASLGDYPNDHTTLRHNNGDGTFSDVSVPSGITDNGQGRGLLTLDYDRDGDLDAVVVNLAGAPIVYRNDGGNANHWLRIDPEGTAGNRDGIGAEVTLVADLDNPDAVQYREIVSGSSFLSQNEMTAHFGLGPTTTTVDQVRIRWTTGIVQTLSGVTADQTLTVTEPLPGDFDGDMAVDADDLQVWQTCASTGALDADMNGDGATDGADLLFWQRWLGKSFQPPEIIANPEPSSTALMALACVQFFKRTRRYQGGAL